MNTLVLGSSPARIRDTYKLILFRKLEAQLDEARGFLAYM